MLNNSLIRRLRNRRGLNLIELAIVMAVVGLIVGGIYVAASAVFRNVRESQTQDDILQIVQNMRSTYGVQNTIAGGAITAAALIQGGIVPADMVATGGTTLINAFGGTVSVSGIAGTPNAFSIILGSVPSTVCSDLILKAMGNGTSSATNIDLYNVTAGATTIANTAFGTTLPATVATDCNAAAGNTTVTFTYGLN